MVGSSVFMRLHRKTDPSTRNHAYPVAMFVPLPVNRQAVAVVELLGFTAQSHHNVYIQAMLIAKGIGRLFFVLFF